MTRDEIKSFLIKRLPPSVLVEEREVLANILTLLTYTEGRKLIEILNDEIFPKEDLK